MEKHSYETYEFLDTSSDSDTNQFFVLQDDGTILAVNKEIQYITQVEDDKNIAENVNVEGCAAVFDVSSQQYYVDVEGNTPEMISINDQFAIANEESNVYANSYLIRPETTSTSQQMETETLTDPQKLDAQQLQQHNVEAFDGAKQTNDLTEITLTDEQYQILEHKGWLLLESNNKIFVLNTLGLHDITSNEKLIQKLKNELQDSADKNTNIGQLKIESVSDLQIENTDDNPQTQGDIVEYFMANNVPIQQVELGENVQFTINEIQEKNELTKVSETNFVASAPMSISKFMNNTDETISSSQKKCDSIKIKTKYTFADIPDKIFLGKTVNAKKLFAKVTKLNKCVNNKVKKNKTQEIISRKNIEQKPHCTRLDGAWFTHLIQDSFRHTSKVDPKFIATGTAVVTQLLRLPNINHSSVGSNIVVTKVITTETENGKEIGQPSIMTGTVKTQDGEASFIHIPLMLHQLLDQAENKIKPDVSKGIPTRDVIDLFHIHISETRFSDKAPDTSINLSKCKFSLDLLIDAKKRRHPNPVFACGSCGAVFKSELLLKDHQNNQCIEVEDELTIDTDDFNSNETLYSVIENGSEKSYSCTLCETKFTRLLNCQKHIKAHKAGIEKKLKVYKCKMCPSTYFHSSSLSKHIVKMHIQMQMN